MTSPPMSPAASEARSGCAPPPSRAREGGEPSLASAERLVAFGRYELLRALGRGGMGQVYEAWDTQLERRVAIKILRDEHSHDLALSEARHLARVAHPNVVGVHEVGRFESLVFIAMELVDGGDLRTWLGERPRRWTQVLDHLIAAAEGLAAVHRAGLVHGDVKPGNVLVGRDGRVCIADFGLARVRARVLRPDLHAVVRRAVEAENGELAGVAEPPRVPGLAFDEAPSPVPAGGTKVYMAPERLRGEAGPRHLADQYSFCVMAWELLFGVRPFAGESAEAILEAIAAGRLERGRRPRAMPKAVEAVLRQGLSERPEDRWPGIDELARALERARSRPRRQLQRAAVIGLVLLMAGVVGRPMLWGSGGGGLVDHVVCMCAGPEAVALARAGDGERALQLLEQARLRASESQMRMLAVASQEVAVELEAQGEWQDAALVWVLSVLLARDADDPALERLGHQGAFKAHRHELTATPTPRRSR